MDDMSIELDDIRPDVRPSLHDINRSFDTIKTTQYDGVVGEEEARMVVFTNFVLGEKPIILKGSRASGKSNILSVVGKYCRTPYNLANTSEKAHKYLKDMNKKSHIIIPEINKVNDAVVEMLKDFGEGAPHIYLYTLPSKETEEVKLEPKPFATSIADENKNVNLLGEELLSRLTVVRTDSSINQNVRVIEEKFKRQQNPYYKKDLKQDEISELIEYVHTLPSIQKFSFIYPAGVAMMKAIPPIFTDSRRDTDKYFANTHGITMFHYWDRMSVEIDGQEYLFVTPADMWYNHRIYQNVLIESSLKCGRIEQTILDILRDHGGERKRDEFSTDAIKGLTVTEIHTHLQKEGLRPTVDSVRKYCEALMDTGYLMRNEESRPHRFEINPHLERNYDSTLNWQSVVETCIDFMTETFPDQADEYIARYCVGKGLKVIDPFTGEEKKITDIETAKPLKKEEPEPKKEPEIEDVELDIDVFADGEEDSQDRLQNEIIELLNDDTHRTIVEIASGTESDIDAVQDTINYLTTIGEVAEFTAGKFGRLS